VLGTFAYIAPISTPNGNPLWARSVGIHSVEGKLPVLVARSKIAVFSKRELVSPRPMSKPVTPSGSAGINGL
jgi:hypothetical protein